MPESNRDEIAKLEALYATNPAGRVFTHLAEAYRKAGDYERARSILEKGLEKHPAYASAHVVLGRVLMDLNKSAEASEAFRKVLQLDPHNLVALRSLGDLARAAGRNAEAMGYFEELRHQDPSNEEISGIIAELLAIPDFHAAEPAEPLPELAAGESQQVEPGAMQTAPEAQIEQLIAHTEPHWGEVESEQETLPGDLADFARQTAPAAEEEFGTVHLEETAPAVPIDDMPAPIEDVLPADVPIDLGPSDAEIEVPAEEAFQSIDYSEFSAPEEPAFEATESAETTLEAFKPEPDLTEKTPQPFEPAPELLEQAPVVFEPAAEVFEPAATTFEPSPLLEPEPTAPSGEVLTETMAELYRSQGLYDRAAEVYRALLLDHPDDLRLKTKLQEVEAAMMPASSAETFQPAPEAPPSFAAVEPEFEASPPFIPTAPEGVHDPFAEAVASSAEEEVESPWTGFNQAAASQPSLYAWTEETPTDVESAPPVSEYFRSLLSWRPSARVQSSFTEPANELEPEPFDLGEPLETAEEPLFEEPSRPSQTSTGAPTQDQSMPWDEATSGADPAQSAGGASDEFDDWFDEELAPEQTKPAQPAPPMPLSMAGETGADDEEDDDLEMFRSWLQSLKK